MKKSIQKISLLILMSFITSLAGSSPVRAMELEGVNPTWSTLGSLNLVKKTALVGGVVLIKVGTDILACLLAHQEQGMLAQVKETLSPVRCTVGDGLCNQGVEGGDLQQGVLQYTDRVSSHELAVYILTGAGSFFGLAGIGIVLYPEASPLSAGSLFVMSGLSGLILVVITGMDLGILYDTRSRLAQVVQSGLLPTNDTLLLQEGVQALNDASHGQLGVVIPSTIGGVIAMVSGIVRVIL